MEWVWVTASIVGGFAVLAWSADRFVEGAASLAYNAGVSRLLVGLTVVGFGTSAPEMVVSAVASYQGRAGLSVGNAVGSNITNTALVVGVAAMLGPIIVRRHVIFKDIPVLLGVMAVVWMFFRDKVLSRIDGTIMLMTLFAIVGWMIFEGLREDRDKSVEEVGAGEAEATLSKGKSLLWIGVGLLALPLAAHSVVWGGSKVAHALGVDDLVVGLTVVAFGTSLPELAASIAAVLKKESDLLIGNIVGSNIFNLLGVMGIAALIDPGRVEGLVMSRDYPTMIAVTFLLLALVGLGREKGASYGGRLRWPGGVPLILVFAAYITWLWSTAQPDFS